MSDLDEIIMRKKGAGILPKGGGLFPVDEQGLELLASLAEERDVGVQIRRRRNPRHHRLYWAILQFVKMHCELFERQSLRMIGNAVKLATGMGETFVDLNTGQHMFVPRSISFASMTQTEFNDFFDVACQVIAQRWMREGTTADDVRRELILMCDGEHAVGKVA